MHWVLKHLGEELVSLLSEYSGSNGMILGQTLDIAAESHPDMTQEELDAVEHSAQVLKDFIAQVEA